MLKVKSKKEKKWIAELNLNPQDVLLIGDTIHDYDVSKHMGCDCLLITNGHNSYEKLVKLKTAIVRSLQEII